MAFNTVKFSEFVLGNLSNTTNMLVGVSASSGGVNYQTPFPETWTTANRPVTPKNGTLGYNTDMSQYEYWNGVAWVQLSSGGSGTVNSGAQNQVAWYATTGTAVSGLLNQPNSVLVTNAGTVPSLQTTLPASLTIPIPDIIGVADASNAFTGSVGEFISSVIPLASALTLSNLININITSITLSAGDWDVWGNISILGPDIQACFGWTSTVSGTTPDASLYNAINNAGSLFNFHFSVPQLRYSLSTSTIIYLSTQSKFSSGTTIACGGIYARRVR